ncbi:MAG: DegV family protein [Anaerolineae bacterium]|nr:DegV family protein [Anaerolineae bacterium]
MVHIITDTTAALPETLARQLGIPIIPQVINFGTESFLEGVDLDKATFMRRLCSERTLPKTAAPPPELFVREFARLAPTGEPILCIHPRPRSAARCSALTARQEFPARTSGA